jgi:HSP20 family protein
MNTTRLPGLVPSLFTPEPFFDEAFRSFMRPFRWEATPELPQIPIDVMEIGDEYLVYAWIPGLKREAIHVEIEGRQVMITADYKKPVFEAKDVRFLRSEFPYGFASRVFTLGYEVDRAKAVAKYVDGVLMLTLPKFTHVGVEPLVVQ